MSRFPALFVSHGAPTLALDPSPARTFLAGYGKALGRPRAIAVVSAHWEAERPQVSAAENPRTIHDFRGFPRSLHEFQYPAPGAPDLAHRAAGLLDAAGLGGEVDPGRGLDHGAWVPLSLLYPEADIPTFQISVQTRLGPDHHRELGEALRPLRDEGVLIFGSGSLTHNLYEFFGQAVDAPPEPYAVAFADWIAAAVAEDRREDLLDYRRRAPHAARAHPTEEHLLPLFVAMGAGGVGRRVHASHSFGILAMDVYAFE